MNILTTIMRTSAVIMLVILTANLGWWLVIKAIGPLLEKARDSIKHQHINNIQNIRTEELRRQREMLAAAKIRMASRKKFVTPSGQTVVLDTLEQISFKRNCLKELHLSHNANWPAIKKAWRRQALIYHPDRGGNQDLWLRKLRAYEALEQMHHR